MNGYKKTLLGFAGVSLAANSYFAVKPTKAYTREKAVGAILGAALNIWLVVNA